MERKKTWQPPHFVDFKPIDLLGLVVWLSCTWSLISGMAKLYVVTNPAKSPFFDYVLDENSKLLVLALHRYVSNS